MPRPQTPVLACPLKWLVTRKDELTKVHTSTRPSSVLTFTLQGERSVDAESGLLVALIHCGQNPVVKISLDEILRNSPGATDIVGVDVSSQQLCIKTPEPTQIVLAQFEGTRDFNVAVCMLRTQIHVSDSVANVLSVLSPKIPSMPNMDLNIPSTFGPRLSSIAPLRNPSLPIDPSLGYQATSTSATMPFSPAPSPVFYSQPIQANHYQYSQPPQAIPSFMGSPNMTMDQAFMSQKLNPYNFFGKRNDMHQPSVGSPLKNSFYPQGFSTGSASSTLPEGDTSYDDILSTSPITPEGITLAQKASPRASTRKSTRVKKAKMSHTESPKHTSQNKRPKQSYDNTSPPGKDTIGSKHDFRDLMPQPRQLPFETQPKEPKKSKKPVPKQQKSLTLADSPSRPKGENISKQAAKKPRVAYVNRGTLCKILDPSRSTSPMPQPTSIHATTVGTQPASTPHSPSCPNASSASPSGIAAELEQIYFPVTSAMLEELDQLTSKLFDGYEADVAHGADQSESATSYMDRIYAVRKEFWYAKLVEMERGKATASI